MIKTKIEIIQEIKNFIINNGGSYPSWYIGISEEPKSRLFDGHNVKEGWIFSEAENSIIAREIEKHFIEELNTSGGSGGGDMDAKFVYAYKKKPHTNP